MVTKCFAHCSACVLIYFFECLSLLTPCVLRPPFRTCERISKARHDLHLWLLILIALFVLNAVGEGAAALKFILFPHMMSSWKVNDSANVKVPTRRARTERFRVIRVIRPNNSTHSPCSNSRNKRALSKRTSPRTSLCSVHEVATIKSRHEDGSKRPVETMGVQGMN